MADLEFLVTDGAYLSDLSEPAVYTDGTAVPKNVLVVPDQTPDIWLDTAPVGVRDIQIAVRVRKSEVTRPVKQVDHVEYHGLDHIVDDFDELNIAEWLLLCLRQS